VDCRTILEGFGEKKEILCPLPEIERQFLGRTSRILVTVPTALSWLPCIFCWERVGGVGGQVYGAVLFEALLEN